MMEVRISAALGELSHNDNAIAWHIPEEDRDVIFTFDNPPDTERKWKRAMDMFVFATLFFTRTEKIEQAMNREGYTGYIDVI